MNWYFKVFRQYADFEGRARRKEYWLFILFHVIALITLSFMALGVFLLTENIAVFATLILIYILATIVPSIAVTVRRLHDVGKSGWWYFIQAVPFVGGIWFFILMCTEGEFKDNEYGPNSINYKYDSQNSTIKEINL